MKKETNVKMKMGKAHESKFFMQNENFVSLKELKESKENKNKKGKK